MSKDSKDKVSNPYIPKFISTKPWYRAQEGDNKEDLLSHQRNGKEIIDFSEAKPGEGIHDDLEITETSRVKNSTGYDSKRDRWFGYNSSDWDAILKHWNDNKSKRFYLKETDDSDDSDFELELIELGLSHNDYKNNSKEDGLEGAMRDRKDVPSYLLNISLNDSKIKYDPQSNSEKDLSEIMNKNDQFVKSNSDVVSLTELQRFAWEENEKDQEVRQRNNFAKKLENLARANDNNEESDSINLDFNIEGNPTYMEYKLREKRKEVQLSKQQKKQRLMSLYGDKASTNEGSNNKVLNKAIIDKLYSESTTAVPSHKEGTSTSSTQLFDEKSTLAEKSENSTCDTNANKKSTAHSLVFGSYYSKGSWGYKCCRQVGRNVSCK